MFSIRVRLGRRCGRRAPFVLLIAGSLVAAEGVRAETAAEGVSLKIGGEARFTAAPEDGRFFNDVDYGHNLLREARLSLTARLRLGGRLALLGELRSENLDEPHAYALYLGYRPFSGRALEIQLGRLPPAFGAYPRRAYEAGDPLVGAPLAYQYLTTLRADAAPASADDMLRQRGAGWLVRYPIGNRAPAAGLPLVSAFRWDAGVQTLLGTHDGRAQLALALTQGSLSNPRWRDDNDGKQLAGRLTLRPATGLVAGVSAARGEYLDEDVAETLAALTGRRQSFRQRALGIDVEYSRGYWLVRGEAIWCGWDAPMVRTPLLSSPLGAFGGFLEGRYRLGPGWTLGARVGRLNFQRILGSAGEATWDAPVSRIETGLAYALRRQLILKLAYQRNWREAGPAGRNGLVAGQLVIWF